MTSVTEDKASEVVHTLNGDPVGEVKVLARPPVGAPVHVATFVAGRIVRQALSPEQAASIGAVVDGDGKMIAE